MLNNNLLLCTSSGGGVMDSLPAKFLPPLQAGGTQGMAPKKGV